VAYFFTVSSSLVSVSVEGEHLGKREITVSVRNHMSKGEMTVSVEEEHQGKR
jgi:hypothetical protein